METREERQWEREGYHPGEEVARLIDEIAELPVGGQIAVLRALARRVMPEMHPDERASFCADLSREGP